MNEETKSEFHFSLTIINRRFIENPNDDLSRKDRYSTKHQRRTPPFSSKQFCYNVFFFTFLFSTRLKTKRFLHPAPQVKNGLFTNNVLSSSLSIVLVFPIFSFAPSWLTLFSLTALTLQQLLFAKVAKNSLKAALI